MFVSCGNTSIGTRDTSVHTSYQNKHTDITATSSTLPENQNYIPLNYDSTKAIWLSQFDMCDIYTNGTRQRSKNDFECRVKAIVGNLKAMGINTVYFQLRPNGDSIYPSNIFPASKYVTGSYGVYHKYDPFKIFLEIAHSENISVHGWINPLRCMNKNEISEISSDHILREWFEKKNGLYIKVVNGVCYLDPVYTQVIELICSGIEEIIDSYDVDGIHIDDYFYPSTTPVGDEFDRPEYDKFVANGGKLSLGDWRRNNVNTLVSGIYRAVKDIDSSVVFGVSPAYNISKDGSDDNYQMKYADLKKWMSTAGYIDYIAPQLYFGYNYPRAEITYDYLLDLWMSMPRNENVKIYIGLAAYKIGDAEADLKSGEWIVDEDILARQTVDAKNKGCDGVIIFNYSTIMTEDRLTTAQRENLKEVLTD